MGWRNYDTPELYREDLLDRIWKAEVEIQQRFKRMIAIEADTAEIEKAIARRKKRLGFS